MAARRACLGWLAAPAALVMALGAIAAAAAPAAGQVARGGEGFEVSFDVVSEGGAPKRVKDFRFRRVRIDCTVGDSFRTRSERPHFGPFRVNRKARFGRTFTNDGQTFDGAVKIRGEFATKRRVDGILEINGDYPASGHSGCTSGKLAWTARLS